MKKSSNFNFRIFERGSGIVMFLIICCSLAVKGQSTQVNSANLNGTPTDFLGWAPGVNSQLQIRHNTPDRPIIFATDGVERMRIKPNRTIGVNTTDNEDARFNIHQDITKGTAVKCVLTIIERSV